MGRFQVEVVRGVKGRSGLMGELSYGRTIMKRGDRFHSITDGWNFLV